MKTESSSLEQVNPLDAVHYAAGTDIGMRREENQDAHGVVEASGFRLYIVCDGMGGVQGGGTASNLAVDVIRRYLQDRDTLKSHDLVAAVTQANAEVFERGNSDPELAGMGTTCVGLAFIGTKLLVLNVGDSRVYRIRQGQVRQLTEDHTLVQELVRSGALSSEQAGNHPVSHMLTRSLGPAPTVEVDCIESPDGPAQGDAYILCSDGLYNLVEPHELVEVFESFEPTDAVQELIELANLRGGTDNITVILITVGDTYPTPVSAFEAEKPRESMPSEVVAPSTPPPPPQQKIVKTPVIEREVRNEEDTKTSVVAPTSEETSPNQEASAVGASKQTATGQVMPHMRYIIAAFLAVLTVGFGFGFLSSRSYHLQNEGTETLVAQPVQASVVEVAREPLHDAQATREQEDTLTLLALQPERSSVAPSVPVDGASIDAAKVVVVAGLSQNEVERVQRRRDALLNQVSSLNEKIAAFDKPLIGNMGEAVQQSRRRLSDGERELDRVRSEIDVATRKLAIWFGRRKRVQETDPINIASEVAVSSAEVRAHKEAFEQATWAYLKEAEVLRYNPADRDQSNRVANLSKTRSEEMRALSQAVREAIEHEVGDADRHISELTLRRDKMESDLDLLRQDIEYRKVLMGSDSRARQIKRNELTRERDVAQAEFEELEALLGGR